MHWSVKGIIKVFSTVSFVVFYLFLIPWLTHELGKSLDWLFLHYFFSIDVLALPAQIVSILRAFGWGVMATGSIIFIKSWLDLARAAKFLPIIALARKNLGPQKLVTTGLYAHVRHPMLLGYLVCLFGLSIVSLSPFMAIWVVPLVGYFSLTVEVETEERELNSWFGKKYREYQKKVPALIPRCCKPQPEKG
ncbi:DUF1295 domain-containing protein [Patescibacteria group bacterium]|nr:DUF1295 domain-containing protein [Patescibacteria group bacterium]MBU1868778.1 DUF1295 domain-containing protein [Patescibacteria group bacterium]